MKKHFFAMLLVFFLIACAVAAWVLLQPPVFQAEARINIPEIKKSTLPPGSPAQQGISLQTVVEILRGNVLAEQVITAISATKLFPGLEQHTQEKKDFLAHVLASFQQQLTITPIKETRIIQIAFQHQEAELSAQVVETLIRLFQKEYRTFQSPEESLHNEQLLVARQQMQQTAQALSIFQHENKLLVGESPDKLTEQYSTMKTLLANEQENLQKQQSHLQRLEEQFAAAFKSVHQDKEQRVSEELDNAQKDLIRLKLYEQELREKYGEGGSGDRLIANVRLQITSLEELLYTKAAVPEAEHEKLNETTEQIVVTRMSYHNQQKKTALLQRQIRQVENKLQRVMEQGGVLRELQQQAETSQRRYANLAKQFEAERTLRGPAEQIRIIEKPVVPLSPIKPQQGPALILALLSGLIGSLIYGMIQMLRTGAANNTSAS